MLTNLQLFTENYDEDRLYSAIVGSDAWLNGRVEFTASGGEKKNHEKR